MKKILLKLLMLILIIATVNIPATPAEAAKASLLEEFDITMNVGTKQNIYTRIINLAGYSPQGKFTISDSSIIGLECRYDKSKEEWDDRIVGLRPGKATLIEYLKNNNKYIKYNITVDRKESDSITSFFGKVKHGEADISSNMIYKPEEIDKAARDILKSLNLEQYNSDRERIAVISRYLYENVTEDVELTEYATSEYDSLILKRKGFGLNLSGALLLTNIGFKLEKSSQSLHGYWAYIKLEGIKYIYDLCGIAGDSFIGSKFLNLRYAGEGSYTNESGEILQGSLYYDENGDIDDFYADTYTFDVNNDVLATRTYMDKTNEEDLHYTSTKRKTHLPAWLIGIETPQQLMLKGNTIALPKDRLSSNVYSSDESIVRIEDNKLIGVKEGIAIVYRYDDTYCDAFYVEIDRDAKPKKQLSVDFKPDGKKHSTYKSSDICIYRRTLNEYYYGRVNDWTVTVLYDWEAALKGGKLQTSFKNGYLKGYVIDSDGNKELVFDDLVYEGYQ